MHGGGDHPPTPVVRQRVADDVAVADGPDLVRINRGESAERGVVADDRVELVEARIERDELFRDADEAADELLACGGARGPTSEPVAGGAGLADLHLESVELVADRSGEEVTDEERGALEDGDALLVEGPEHLQGGLRGADHLAGERAVNGHFCKVGVRGGPGLLEAEEGEMVQWPRESFQASTISVTGEVDNNSAQWGQGSSRGSLRVVFLACPTPGYRLKRIDWTKNNRTKCAICLLFR